MFHDRGEPQEPAPAADGKQAEPSGLTAGTPDTPTGSPDAGTLNAGTPNTAHPSASHRRRDPRERILDAMIETVAARGYDRTTVRHVMASTRLDAALFSEHFDDKHDCFFQAVDDLLSAGEHAALELFEADLPWSELVSAGLEGLLSALADHPAAAYVLLVELPATGPDLCTRRRVATTLLTALMEQGRDRGTSDEELPIQTSEAIVGGVLSILHRRVLLGETAKLPTLCDDLAYFALLPYVGQERAAALTS